MQTLYNLNKALMPKFESQIYSTKKNKVKGLFDIPVDNAIATTEIGNAITLLNFNGEKVEYTTIKKNFLDYVNGTGHMSIFSDEIIAYSIGRGFLIFNILNNKFNYYSIAGHFNYVISDFYSVELLKKMFVFKIRDRSEKQPTFLRLLDLSTETSTLIKEKEVGDCGITVRDGVIFVYNKDNITALDLGLEEINHPLIEAFNKAKNKDFSNIIELVIHPYLPFAVIKEEKFDENYDSTATTWVLSWALLEKNETNEHKCMYKILSKKSYCYKFSYDGKWLWFIDSSESNLNYILMPVNKKLEHFLDKPIFLGEIPRYPNGMAMTRNPSGLVISECEGYKGKCWLKKWDFTEAEKLIKNDK